MFLGNILGYIGLKRVRVTLVDQREKQIAVLCMPSLA